MKKITLLLFSFAWCAFLSVGCSTGPGESTVEEAAKSMEESMEVDTMAETMDDPAAEGEAATPP